MTLRSLTPPLLVCAVVLWTFALGRTSIGRGWTDASWAVAAVGEVALLVALAAMWADKHR